MMPPLAIHLAQTVIASLTGNLNAIERLIPHRFLNDKRTGLNLRGFLRALRKTTLIALTA